MNGKKAKALRRRAQDATVGQQRAVYRDRWFQRAYEALAITCEMETRTYHLTHQLAAVRGKVGAA